MGTNSSNIIGHEPPLSIATPKRGRPGRVTTINSRSQHLGRSIQTVSTDLAIGRRVQYNRSESAIPLSLHQCSQVGQTLPFQWFGRVARPPAIRSTPGPWWSHRRVGYQNRHLPPSGHRPGVYYLVVGQVGGSSASTDGKFLYQSRNHPAYPGPARSPVSNRSNLVRKQRSRFRGKKNAIIQIYRHRPHWGQVVCFDEMGPLQTIPRGGKAWSRQTPLRPDRYKRNGTLQWFCAFSPHTGLAIGKGFPAKSADWCRAFWMDYLLPSWPRGRIHLVMDNLGAHKKAFRELPARIRRRIRVYWTPTNSSWLNLVESYFATLQRAALHNTDFRTPAEIEHSLHRATDYLNEKPRAYVWKKI